MEFSTLLANVHARSGLYGLDGSYGQYVAFVNGCDLIQDGKPLDGFRDWLITRLGYGTNLVWWALVRLIAAAEQDNDPNDLNEPDLVNKMFELLDQFLTTNTTTPNPLHDRKYHS